MKYADSRLTVQLKGIPSLYEKNMLKAILTTSVLKEMK